MTHNPADSEKQPPFIAEGTSDWLEAEDVIGDAISSLPVGDLFEDDGPREIMRALEAAGFIVLKRGIPMPGPR